MLYNASFYCIHCFTQPRPAAPIAELFLKLSDGCTNLLLASSRYLFHLFAFQEEKKSGHGLDSIFFRSILPAQQMIDHVEILNCYSNHNQQVNDKKSSLTVASSTSTFRKTMLGNSLVIAYKRKDILLSQALLHINFVKHNSSNRRSEY